MGKTKPHSLTLQHPVDVLVPCAVLIKQPELPGSTGAHRWGFPVWRCAKVYLGLIPDQGRWERKIHVPLGVLSLTSASSPSVLCSFDLIVAVI